MLHSKTFLLYKTQECAPWVVHIRKKEIFFSSYQLLNTCFKFSTDIEQTLEISLTLIPFFIIVLYKRTCPSSTPCSIPCSSPCSMPCSIPFLSLQLPILLTLLQAISFQPHTFQSPPFPLILLNPTILHPLMS